MPAGLAIGLTQAAIFETAAYGASVATAYQVLKRGLDALGGAVAVGQQAWDIFFGDANTFLENAVDGVSNLDVPAITSVFGKAGASGLDTAITAASEKAIQRVVGSSAQSFVRRYTNRPGVQESDGRALHFGGIPPIITFDAVWHQVPYLQPDEVFLVQKIMINNINVSGVIRQMGLAVGRPWGPFANTGGHVNYHREGQIFNASINMGIRTFENFAARVRVSWTVNAIAPQGATVIDLSPNFIPLRSYMLIWQTGLLETDQVIVRVMGKSVKWLMPIEAF